MWLRGIGVVLILIIFCFEARADNIDNEANVLVLKDVHGNVVEARNVEEFRKRIESEENGAWLSIRLNVGSDYDPVRMGEVEEYAQFVSRKAVEIREKLIEEVAGRGRVTVRYWMNPLPWLIVNVDLSGFNAIISNLNAQIISESISMSPFLDLSLTQINAAPLHFAGGTGSGKAVAVIDSGLQRSHPMFSGAIVGEACFVTPPFYLTYDSCPSGYGATTPGSGEACTAVTNCQHGTHVAGIAAGRLQYSSGTALQGVAPSAPIVAVRIASAKTSPGASGPDINYGSTDLAAALSYLYSSRFLLGISAVNVSCGNIQLSSIPVNGYCDSIDASVTDAIDLLFGAGIPVVAAAGTHTSIGSYPGKVAFPACIQNAVRVSSVARNGKFENGASANSSIVDLLAPGGSYPAIYSTSNILSALPGSTYGYLGGTSMAAPHVAGAIAALRSGPWSSPELTVTQVVDHLKQTGSLVSLNMDNTSASYVHPLIDLGAAIVSPSTPSYFNVNPLLCYGMNELDWGGSVGIVSHYAFQGSANSIFTSPYVIVPNSSGVVTVSGTTWLRVKACDGPACSAWKTGSKKATYTSGCL